MRNRMGSSLNLDTTVVGLQGHPISSVGPTSGQALVFDGTDWTPTDVQTTAPPPAAVGPTPPAGPGEGDLWFNTTTGILNVWNGSAWVPTYVDSDPFLPLAGGTLTGPLVLSGDAAAPLNPVTLQQMDAALASLPPSGAVVSDTAPANPTDGDLWWDTVSGQLFIWYVDANSSQWVVANVAQGVPGPEGPAGPAGPAPIPPFNGPIIGVTNGSNAAAGMVGQFITASGSSPGSATSPFSGNVCTITLPAGDWLVGGHIQALGTGVVYTSLTCVFSDVPGIGFPGSLALAGFSTPAGFNMGFDTGPVRRNVTTSTSIILQVQAVTFSGGTCSFNGTINAWRMR